jgi:hypothetical protein
MSRIAGLLSDTPRPDLRSAVTDMLRTLAPADGGTRWTVAGPDGCTGWCGRRRPSVADAGASASSWMA